MRRRERLDPELVGLPERLVRFRPTDWPDFVATPRGGGVSGLFWAARRQYDLKHGTTLPLDGPAPDEPFDPSTI